MKKYLFLIMICLNLACAPVWAGDGDQRIGVDAGIFFPSTISTAISYEHELSYGKSFDLVGEIGNHWQTPACCRFWKGYYWDAGFGYKLRLKRYKNSMLLLRLGGQLGSTRGDFFLGCNLTLEYDYVLPSGIRLCVAQKNDFNFLHGDHFRNGLTIGVKFPI